MKNRNSIPIFVSLVLLAFCAPKQPIPESLSVGKEGSPDKSLVVTGDAVLFLTLTQSELDSSGPKKYDQASETLWDFYANAKRVTDIIEKHGLNYQYSDAKNLEFQSSKGRITKISFDTSKHIVAVVLYKTGKEPKICYGLIGVNETLREISDYFGVDFK